MLGCMARISLHPKTFLLHTSAPPLLANATHSREKRAPRLLACAAHSRERMMPGQISLRQKTLLRNSAPPLLTCAAHSREVCCTLAREEPEISINSLRIFYIKPAGSRLPGNTNLHLFSRINNIYTVFYCSYNFL